MKEIYFATLYCIFFTCNALGTCILGALSGVVWSQLNGTQKVCITFAVLANWSGTMMAFFSRAISRLENKEPIIDTNGGAIATKTIINEKTVDSTVVTAKSS